MIFKETCDDNGLSNVLAVSGQICCVGDFEQSFVEKF